MAEKYSAIVMMTPHNAAIRIIRVRIWDHRGAGFGGAGSSTSSADEATRFFPKSSDEDEAESEISAAELESDCCSSTAFTTLWRAPKRQIEPSAFLPTYLTARMGKRAET